VALNPAPIFTAGRGSQEQLGAAILRNCLSLQPPSKIPRVLTVGVALIKARGTSCRFQEIMLIRRRISLNESPEKLGRKIGRRFNLQIQSFTG